MGKLDDARKIAIPLPLSMPPLWLPLFATPSLHAVILAHLVFDMRLGSLFSLFCLSFAPLLAKAQRGSKTAIPDFTKGAVIPEGMKHDWNLGATGARGWIYCDRMVTTDARQILITKVAKGSPADGVFAENDVILGVSGKRFSFDPRTEFGRALTVAETKKEKGLLKVIRWRNGKTEEVTLKLSVLGSYSRTSPYKCTKSQAILEKGCASLAQRMQQPGYRENTIPRALNALALLASGNPEYLPLIRREVDWAAAYQTRSFQTWYYGYVIMLLSEYVLATGDRAVMPGLTRLATEAAVGQSIVGSWGHRFANPDGRLAGYGMMNSPGLTLTTSLTLARKAGVKTPEVERAIERSTRLLRFYIGKGAVPYGDHNPWIENHEDNGKCGMASVLFTFMNEPKGAEFFSRMSVASHGNERDTGHTGNFFNVLWAIPGVAQSGPNATGAWIKEFGAWYFDLARQWDGTFRHQGPPQPGNDSYADWDATGAFMLAYARPLKKIHLTGKRDAIAPQLDKKAAERLIREGRGWSNKDRYSAYDALGRDVLLETLTNWSPIVRERSAIALSRLKGDAPVAPLNAMLQSSSLNAQLGACQAIARLKVRASGCVDTLIQTLDSTDLWVRIKAAEALSAIGKPAIKSVPKLLKLFTVVDLENDPRGMQQRYFSYALFRRGGLLSGSLKGIDMPTFYKAIEAGLKNEDGRARGSLSSVYRTLSKEQIKPLLPAILKAVVEPASSGVMFASQVRLEGLKVLANHHVKEGVKATVDYLHQQNRWASEKRTPQILKILHQYGAAAKPFLPQLEEIAADFDDGEPDFPRRLSRDKALMVREAIEKIKVAKTSPELTKIR